MKTETELKLEFEKLKQLHKNVSTIQAPLDDEGTKFATLFLKRADRATHAVVGKLAQGNDPLKAVEACLKNCYIGGDDLNTVLNDEEALMSCEIAIVEFLQKRLAILKKN
jgi:hypothetical protein